MKCVSDIIKSFGGPKAFGDYFGTPRSTVNTWRRRNYLPPEMDVPLVTEARRRKISLTFEHLARMRHDANS